MQTGTTERLIYAVVPYRGKYKTMKVFKIQIFTLRRDGIKDHLIGEAYRHLMSRELIYVKQEKGVCHIIPIILTKFTFRHEPHKKKHLPRITHSLNYIYNYY